MGPAAEEGVGPAAEEAELPVLVPGVEPKSDLTTGITSAFSTFKAQLEEHFTVSSAGHLGAGGSAVNVDRCSFQVCWRDVQTEVLQSLEDCQQQVSTLLADVHRQRYRPLTHLRGGGGHAS